MFKVIAPQSLPPANSEVVTTSQEDANPRPVECAIPLIVNGLENT